MKAPGPTTPEKPPRQSPTLLGGRSRTGGIAARACGLHLGFPTIKPLPRDVIVQVGKFHYIEYKVSGPISSPDDDRAAASTPGSRGLVLTP